MFLSLSTFLHALFVPSRSFYFPLRSFLGRIQIYQIKYKLQICNRKKINFIGKKVSQVRNLHHDKNSKLDYFLNLMAP